MSMSYLAVISISKNEVVFVMNNEHLTKEKAINNIKEITSLKAVISGSIEGRDQYNNINYKVIKVEVKNESN
jgi:hypothetical protein